MHAELIAMTEERDSALQEYALAMEMERLEKARLRLHGHLDDAGEEIRRLTNLEAELRTNIDELEDHPNPGLKSVATKIRVQNVQQPDLPTRTNKTKYEIDEESNSFLCCATYTHHCQA
jgi:hypothetical protein